MKKFIVLYYAPISAEEQIAGATPEKTKAGMEPWMNWAKKCGDSLLDMGGPLGNAQNIKKSGVSKSQSKAVGYSILQGDNMEKIVGLMKEHPHLMWNPECEIEIHEVLAMPGM